MYVQPIDDELTACGTTLGSDGAATLGKQASVWPATQAKPS